MRTKRGSLRAKKTTINQKLKLFEQMSPGSREGLETAISTSSYPVAALKCRQGVKSWLV
jgi:hypothetical protein